DGEEPSAADAAQVGGRGAQRPAVEDAVAGASHRVGVRTEDEAATAALRRETQKRAVEHCGVRLDHPRTPHERELAAEKARVRRDGAEQMILEHRDVGDPILAQLARNVPGRSQRALDAEQGDPRHARVIWSTDRVGNTSGQPVRRTVVRPQMRAESPSSSDEGPTSTSTRSPRRSTRRPAMPPRMASRTWIGSPGPSQAWPHTRPTPSPRATARAQSPPHPPPPPPPAP